MVLLRAFGAYSQTGVIWIGTNNSLENAWKRIIARATSSFPWKACSLLIPRNQYPLKSAIRRAAGTRRYASKFPMIILFGFRKFAKNRIQDTPFLPPCRPPQSEIEINSVVEYSNRFVVS